MSQPLLTGHLQRGTSEATYCVSIFGTRWLNCGAAVPLGVPGIIWLGDDVGAAPTAQRLDLTQRLGDLDCVFERILGV